MTTLHEVGAKMNKANAKAAAGKTQFGGKVPGLERREHRRHDFDQQAILVERWDGTRRAGQPFGQIVDLSAGGVRIRTEHRNVKADQQIRVRLELPAFAGICPFVDSSSEEGLRPKREWVGWMAVTRVHPLNDRHTEVAGRLVDMEELDRGMLGLYLSTQPLAA